MTISLSDLKAKRAAMTQGEWRLELDRNDQQNIHTDNLWIALLPHQCLASIEQEQERNATGIVATHNAADVLIAVCEAALVWRGPPGGGRSDAEVIMACETLLATLAKITP